MGSVARGTFAVGLDVVEIMMDVEETFGVWLPEARISKVRTVGDLHECIVAILQQEQKKQRVNREEVWCILQAIVARVLGIDQKIVTPNSLFVEDLGIG